MVSYKDVLDLSLQGLNNSQIKGKLGCDRNTIRSIIEKATMMGLYPKGWESVSDEQLKRLLKKKTKPKSEYLEPDYEWIHKELCDPMVTVNLLWEEYQQAANAEGKEAYSRTQFFDKYTVFANVVKCGAHIKRRPGDSLELDFAGDLLYIVDPLLYTRRSVVLFLATLSFSKLLYVEAIDRQSAVCFTYATMNAMEWHGGVCRILIPDNTRAAVIVASKKDLAVLNEMFREMGEHYGITVVPAPPRTPKAKPNVESGVNDAYHRILAPLRHCTFYSIDDLNDALWKQCEIYNNEGFKEFKGWSRRSLFEAEEREQLSQLPPFRFEVREKATATVRENCHARCKLDDYYYSVPQNWIGKTVVLKLGAKDVKIFSEFGEFIYCHLRGTCTYDRYMTERSHLPSHIQQYVYASPEMFRDMAIAIGENTYQVIDRLFVIAERNDRAPEVEYQTARSILSMGKKTKKNQWFSPSLLEEACRALVVLQPNPFVRIAYSHIKNKMDDIAGRTKSAEVSAFIKQGKPELDMFELLGGKR